MGKIGDWYDRAVQFLTEDIWKQHSRQMNKRAVFPIRALKIMTVTIRQFLEDQVNMRAAALTLYTLLSIIPIAALAFAVAKGFGIDQQIKADLTAMFAENTEILNTLLQFIDNTLDNTKGGWLAGVGLVMLLWTVINMLVNVEDSFNHIWQIKHGRTWVRRFSDYLSVMLIGPVAIFMASSLTVTFKYYMNTVTEAVPFLGSVTPFLFNLIPYVVIWLLFAFIYKVMPNTKVKLMPALVAGVMAGTVFQLVEQFYFYSQVSLSKYNAIYGSFAAIPLFIIWARLSWQIVLFGAELSFAYQNIELYEYNEQPEKLSNYSKYLLSLFILCWLIQQFVEEKKAPTAEEVSGRLNIPIRSARYVLSELTEMGIIAEIMPENDEDITFQPAVDVHKISLSYVITRMNSNGDPVDVDKNLQLQQFSGVLDDFYKKFHKESSSILLMDMKIE